MPDVLCWLYTTKFAAHVKKDCHCTGNCSFCQNTRVTTVIVTTSSSWL